MGHHRLRGCDTAREWSVLGRLVEMHPVMFVLLVLALSYPRKDRLGPIKDFWNRKVIDRAIQSSQPFLNRTIYDEVDKLQLKLVDLSPEWLKYLLKDAMNQDSQDNPIKNKLLSGLLRVFDPILFKFTDAIGVELALTASRLRVNLNDNIQDSIRRNYYWHRLDKRNWYHDKIERLIQSVSGTIHLSINETMAASRDDYGNRLGDTFRDIINLFLPKHIRIRDLAIEDVPYPNAQGMEMNAAGLNLQIIRYLQNEIKVFICRVRINIMDQVQETLVQLNEDISRELDVALRKKAKESLPFYS